jgi:hypothetical protein
MTDTTNPQADLPARLEAVLTERFTELGNPFSEMRRHEQGPDGWPASHPVGPHQVAEVLRELLAAVPVPAPAPADRAAEWRAAADHLLQVRDSLITDPECTGKYLAGIERAADELRRADAVPVSGPGGAADETRQPEPVDRAAIRAAAFDEAAAHLAGLDPVKAALAGQHAWKAAAGIVRHMAVQERRMADGEQQPQPVPPVEHCIHDRTVHRTHHKTAPVTGCPWCTTATAAEEPS